MCDQCMTLAKAMANNSPDPSTKVGAVLFKGSLIIATGWNDFPQGVDSKVERWLRKEDKYPRVVHAEANVLLAAAYVGTATRGSTLYTTEFPCPSCTGLIIQAGVKEVYTQDTNSDYGLRWADQIEISRSMFKEAGVKVIEIPR